LTIGLEISPNKDEHKWLETNETMSLFTPSKAEANDTFTWHSNCAKMPITPPPPSSPCKVKNLTTYLSTNGKTQEDNNMQGCIIDATWYRRFQGFLAMHSKQRRGARGRRRCNWLTSLPPSTTCIKAYFLRTIFSSGSMGIISTFIPTLILTQLSN